MNNPGRPTGAWHLAAAVALALAGGVAQAADAAASAADDAQRADKQRQEAQQQLKEAHERLEQDARRVAELSMAASGGAERIEKRIVVRRGGGVRLGVMIDDTGAAGDGVHVRGVTPGGPAQAAGLRADDRIVSIGGTALGGEGGAGTKRLMEVVSNAKPGEPLAIEYRRDGKVVKAQVVPRKAAEVEGEGDDLPMMQLLHGEHGEHGLLGGDMMGHALMLASDRHGLGATQLVELSPGLGSYFGADKGLLVVRAPADGRFKLQDGDVLLDIDGRVPTGVSHAMQILASYRGGETARLHVLRQKKRVELAVEVPAD